VPRKSQFSPEEKADIILLGWKGPNDTIELQGSLMEFQRWYNQVREHSALNYQYPEEVYHDRKEIFK